MAIASVAPQAAQSGSHSSHAGFFIDDEGKSFSLITTRVLKVM